MKKILFVLVNMNVGGTEKALLNMIQEIPREEFEVSILMLEKYGGFLKEIPSHVKKIYCPNYSGIKNDLNKPPLELVNKYIGNKRYIRALNILSLSIVCKMVSSRKVFFKYILRNTKLNLEEYDVAIAYDGPMDFITYLILNKVRARKKVQWIHFDIEKIWISKCFMKRNYKNFDKIFIASNEACNKFKETFPTLQDKCEVLVNIVPKNLLDSSDSNMETFNDNFKGLRILTVGRLSYEKGQDLIPEVVYRLLADGIKFRWYLIGDGILRNECMNMINRLSIQEQLVLLGTKTNPYYYLRDCDIYVQPSRHEGYCITLAEARRFAKPIVTTNFLAAKEQIINEKTGLIVDGNIDNIYKGVKKLLTHQTLRHELSNNLLKDDSSDLKNIECFLDYIRA